MRFADIRAGELGSENVESSARAATKFMETQRPAASVCFRLTYYNINRAYVISKFRILHHDLYL